MCGMLPAAGGCIWPAAAWDSPRRCCRGRRAAAAQGCRGRGWCCGMRCTCSARVIGTTTRWPRKGPPHALQVPRPPLSRISLSLSQLASVLHASVSIPWCRYRHRRFACREDRQVIERVCAVEDGVIGAPNLGYDSCGACATTDAPGYRRCLRAWHPGAARLRRGGACPRPACRAQRRSRTTRAGRPSGWQPIAPARGC